MCLQDTVESVRNKTHEQESVLLTVGLRGSRTTLSQKSYLLSKEDQYPSMYLGTFEISTSSISSLTTQPKRQHLDTLYHKSWLNFIF